MIRRYLSFEQENNKSLTNCNFLHSFFFNSLNFILMEISSLSRLCLESVADNMAMWCQSALKEDFYKYLYAIGPFNDLSKLLN